MVQLNFDANQVAPNTGYEPVPEGWYNVAISESEMKPTKDGNGAYLQLKMSIIDGPHTGKPIFVRLNLQNQNQTAVDIAYGELSAICHATGVYQVADSSQLHGIPFQVKVNVRKSTDDKGNSIESNDVKAYKDAAGNEPGKAPLGGGAPANFGGQSAQQQPAQQGGFGGQPQNQGAAQNQGGGWGGQPQGNGQAPANAGMQHAGDPAQNNPATASPSNGGFGGGAPTQQAAPQGQPDGNAGWTQNQGNQPAQGGGAPWGAQGGNQ